MNKKTSPLPERLRSLFFLIAGLIIFCGVGCQSGTKSAGAGALPTTSTNLDTAVTLREGDAIRVIFPSAAALSVQQLIRRDGRIAIPVLGEINAAGLTPSQLEKAILEKFGKDLVSKEVTVTIESISYVVFVNGAVLRPGRIQSNRPLSALEAIMEAGGFDRAKANLKKVRIIRTEGENKTFELDFSGLDKGNPPNFPLKPSDIVVVPERFNLF